MNPQNVPVSLLSVLRQRPRAWAQMRGSREFPQIWGQVYFHETDRGVLVAAEMTGLPGSVEPCGGRFFGLHIHSGGACAGDEGDPFREALTHYNPRGCLHPYHAGDLPPLLGAGGEALLVTLTDRFSLPEVVGRTVIVHSAPDDFTTQPAGNAGRKMACGVIRPFPARENM